MTPLEMLQADVGRTYVSDWLSVDQGLIDRFADVTDDHQFIHVDPERAAQTPFGGTVAHGFLLLSLLPKLHAGMARETPEAITMRVNYGFDRIRFVQPVRAGARVRARTTIASVEEKRPGQLQQLMDVTLEIEASDKPALTAVWLTQFFV